MHFTTKLWSLLLLPLVSYANFPSGEQIPMGFESVDSEYIPHTMSQPKLSDLLTIEPSASIFYSYARELELSAMFSDPNTKLTLLVPTNKAVMSLSRKPHEDPESAIDIESDEQFYELSKKNVERWVSAHIIPEFPLSLDAEQHRTLLDGKSVSFSPNPEASNHDPEWSQVLVDGEIKITQKKQGLNGDIYLLDGTISRS